MSAAASWSYTAVATLWPMAARDAWLGGKTFGAPVAVLCDYKAESKVMTDATGEEFTCAEVIYTERADIKRGDRILIGVSALADPIAASAREVRSVTRYGDTFERTTDDYLVATV